MKAANILVYSAALTLVIASAAAYSQPRSWTNPPRAAAAAQSSVCASFASISTTTTALAGATNGIVGTPLAGETYTINVTGSQTASFRIVGNDTGTVTFAGPSPVPGTLHYTVTSSTPPAGSIGVGYYFDSGDGTVTITASCSGVQTTPAPALGLRGLIMLGLLLALAGGAFAARRSRQR